MHAVVESSFVVYTQCAHSIWKCLSHQTLTFSHIISAGTFQLIFFYFPYILAYIYRIVTTLARILHLTLSRTRRVRSTQSATIPAPPPPQSASNVNWAAIWFSFRYGAAGAAYINGYSIIHNSLLNLTIYLPI